MDAARQIWARGLTSSDIGKRIGFPGITEEWGILRGIEHFDGSTVLLVTMPMDLANSDEVVVIDG